MASFEVIPSTRYACVDRQLSTASSRALRSTSRVLRPSTSARSVKACAKLQGGSVTAGVVAASVISPAAASASTIKDLAVDLQEKIDAASAVGGEISSKAEGVVKLAKGAAEASKPLVDAASPYAKKVADAATDAGSKAFDTVAKTAAEKLSGAGVDTDTVAAGSKSVMKVAGSAVDTAAPVVKNVGGSIVETLTTSDAVTLATEAAVVLGLISTSSIWVPALATAFRGYAGELSPPTSLDILNTEDCLLIDLRSPEEILGKGSPALPRGVVSKMIQVELARVKDKKLRSAMASPFDLEVSSTAVIISSLKKVKKGLKILLLDTNGSLSPKVAAKLAGMGYGNTYVISGGFEGRGGWTQSSLSVTEGTSAPTGGIFGTQRN